MFGTLSQQQFGLAPKQQQRCRKSLVVKAQEQPESKAQPKQNEGEPKAEYPKAEPKQKQPEAAPKAAPKAKAKGAVVEPRKVIDRQNDQLWFATDQSLTYLDGSLPADYGFDPLGLSDPDGKADTGYVNPSWLKYSEVIHSRYAMLGAAGCVAPELLGKWGLGPEIAWFKVGIVPPAGTYPEGYWASPYALFFIELIFFHLAELRRWQDFKYPGSMGKENAFYPLKIGFLSDALKGSGDPAYPGGPVFDFGGFSREGAFFKFDRLKVNEVKNGRLAMIAMFGFGAQAVLTGVGPVQNLIDHIRDPFNNNMLAYLAKAPSGSFFGS